MKSTTLTFIFTLLILQVSYAQMVDKRKRADSLLHCYENIDELNAKEKASLYFSLALTYGKLNLDTAFVFANEGIDYAKTNDNTFLCGRMYLAKASLYNYNDQLEQAVLMYDTTIKTCLSANDSIAAASALNDKGVCLQKLNRFDEAKQAYFEAGKLFLDLDKEAMVGNTHSARALLQYQTGEYIEAIKSANKAIQIFQKYNYPGFMSSPLNILGNIAEKKKDYNTALDYYNKSKAIEEKENDLTMLITLQAKLTSIAIAQEKYDEAEKEVKKGLEFCEDYGNNEIKTALLLNLAKIKLRNKEFKEAEEILLRTENIILKKGHEEELAILYEVYSIYHQKLKNYQIAIDYSKRAIEHARKVPFQNYEQSYVQLKELYEYENMDFVADFPEAKAYIDSVNQQLAVLESIPFGINVTDINQPTFTQKRANPKPKNNLWFVVAALVLGGLVSLYLYRQRQRRKNSTMADNTSHSIENQQFQLPDILPVINKRPVLNKQLQAFDRDVNQNILLKNHLYRDVKKSQALVISELTKGLYSVRQIRDNFKAINFESFNDYKFKLRVTDYINAFINSCLDSEQQHPDSNNYGLDSERQLSIVFNSITGIKVSTYKKLVRQTAGTIVCYSDDLNPLKEHHTTLELHANILRQLICRELKADLLKSIDEQVEKINKQIAGFQLDSIAIDELKALNKKSVGQSDIFELYMSALFFWTTEKEKYPFEFIQNLSSIFWGIHLTKEAFDAFQTKVMSLNKQESLSM